MTLITLLSDFGEHEPWTAMLQGALRRAAPGVELTSLRQDFDSLDLRTAALYLRRAAFAFPAPTIHLVGIDPDWGESQALVAEAGGQLFLAADNGVLTPSLLHGTNARVWKIVKLPEGEPSVRPGFLARDVLAPVAAALAQGAVPEQFGPRFEGWRRLPWPMPWRRGAVAGGEVLHCDRFGNIMTNLTHAELPEWAAGSSPGPGWTLHVGAGTVVHWRGDAAPGTPFAYWGPEEWLELALRNASAAEAMQAAPGMAVEVRLLK